MSFEDLNAKREREEAEKKVAGNRWKNTVAIFGVFVLLPAFVRWKVPPDVLDPMLLIAAAGVGGALAGFVWRVEARTLGALGGAVAGVGALYALDFYLADRTEVFDVELLIPLILGCLPGVLIFVGISRMERGGAVREPSRRRRR